LLFVQRGGNAAGHRDVDSALLVVPFQGKATVEGAGPIKGNAAQGLDGVDEVAGVLLANIFDAKVVDDQGEGDRTGMMRP
jgi:hypothetical protein